jgi:hypothetical protein
MRNKKQLLPISPSPIGRGTEGEGGERTHLAPPRCLSDVPSPSERGAGGEGRGNESDRERLSEQCAASHQPEALARAAASSKPDAQASGESKPEALARPDVPGDGSRDSVSPPADDASQPSSHASSGGRRDRSSRLAGALLDSGTIAPWRDSAWDGASKGHWPLADAGVLSSSPVSMLGEGHLALCPCSADAQCELLDSEDEDENDE